MFKFKVKCPFQKKVFARNVIRANGENKTITCSSYIEIMSFCNS